MITLTVEDKKYNLADRYSVEQWQQMKAWDFNEPLHWPIIINLATGIPVSTLKKVDEESLMLAIGFIVGILNGRTQSELPDFNTYNFGQFVDMDCYISLGVEKHIEDMLAVMGLEIAWSDEALWVVEQYINWRNNIYYQYKNLFGLDDKDFESFLEDYEGPEDPMQIAKGWYKIIVDLSNDDLLKIDEVTEQPLKKVLTFMNHRKEVALKAAEEARQMRNKQKVK